jgi:hypothetical protein
MFINNNPLNKILIKIKSEKNNANMYLLKNIHKYKNNNFVTNITTQTNTVTNSIEKQIFNISKLNYINKFLKINSININLMLNSYSILKNLANTLYKHPEQFSYLLKNFIYKQNFYKKKSNLNKLNTSSNNQRYYNILKKKLLRLGTGS